MKAERFLNVILYLSGLLFVLAAIMALLTPRVYAGERMDNVESLSPEDYCEVITDEFLAGVLSQANGSARAFKHGGAAVLENYEHGIPLPKDAMYVPQWDSLSDVEKDFVRAHVLEGYDEAAKIGRMVTDEEAVAMARAYYQQCLKMRKAEAESPFRKVEALENVAPSKRFAQCTEWLSDYNVIGMAVKHGRDCDQMKDWTKNTDGVQDERRAKIARLLDEACAAGRDGVDAWFEGYAKQCMGRL